MNSPLFLHRLMLLPFFLWGIIFCAFPTYASVPKEISFLYQTVEDKGFFLSGTRQLERNRKLIPNILQSAPNHGLVLEQFYTKQLSGLLAAERKLNNEQKQALDKALTFSLWQYAAELSGGYMTEMSFLDLVLSKDIQSAVESLAPQSELYNALKSRLIVLNEQLNNGDIQVNPEIKFDGLLRPGNEHANVPLLRARFFDELEYVEKERINDSSESIEDETDSKSDDDQEDEFNQFKYDKDLVEVIRQYQSTVGLVPDGVIGPSTLKYLNRNAKDERKQIVANMARLRGVEWRNRPDMRIDVDIARYWLKAYEDRKVIFEMPVVVGTKSRQTVQFSTVMTGVRLNPGWTLPPTIKAEDYIPKLRSDPEWVTERGVKIYPSWDPEAEAIDPTLVDWSLFEDNEIKAMRMYKDAGEENPLGKYRFLMHNKHDIYLHDTPSKYLFDRAMRAKSSGCVRISDPRRVAEFLLKDDPAWTKEKIDEVLASNETYDVGAKRKIPVYFDYKTVWLNDDSELVMGVDVYDFDNQMYNDIVSFQGETGRTIKNLIQDLPIQENLNESKGAIVDLINSLF